jgi:hypothetical protein
MATINDNYLKLKAGYLFPKLLGGSMASQSVILRQTLLGWALAMLRNPCRKPAAQR